MFSQALRRLVQSASSSRQVPVHICDNIGHVNVTLAGTKRGIHDVSVTGKVFNVCSFKNGTMTFYVRSAAGNNFKKNHKIVVLPGIAAVFNMAKTNLEINQTVFVQGKLNSNRIVTENEKHRTTTAIMATELRIINDFAVESDSKSATTPIEAADENTVELFGHISSNVTGNDFKSFTLATIKDLRSSNRKAENFCYHRIFVYDKVLFPKLSEGPAKGDTFLVRGEISYKMEKNHDGKNISTSYIKANQLYRII